MFKKIFVLLCFLAFCKAEYDLDEMALSACIGMSASPLVPAYSTIVAVRRQCNNLAADCKTVCQNAPAFSNGAANKFSCFNSVHVYKNRPDLGERTGGTVETSAPAGEGQVRPPSYYFCRYFYILS